MKQEELKNEEPNNPEGPSGQVLAEFEKLVAELSEPVYLFRLYVSGASPRSALAITNIRNICEKYLPGRYELEVVDVFQQPGATKEAQIVAVPTLIKELPLPRKKFVGDMSDVEKIVVGLKLRQ
jgi:circadian clock protein KaiB